MDEKQLRDVFEKEFNRVYSQAWFDGFIAGALEAQKQIAAKEKPNEHTRTKYPA